MKIKDMTDEQIKKLEKKYTKARRKFFKNGIRTGTEAAQFRDNFLKENGVEI